MNNYSKMDIGQSSFIGITPLQGNLFAGTKFRHSDKISTNCKEMQNLLLISMFIKFCCKLSRNDCNIEFYYIITIII